MKINILLLQFRKNNLIADQEKECILRSFNKDVVLFSKNIFDNDINITGKELNKIDGIIIGGSGDFSIPRRLKRRELWLKIRKTAPLIKKAIKKNIPILGICFGHQYLAYLLGSKIISSKKQEEIGSFKISLTKKGAEDPLFKDMPSDFPVQEGHKNCVKTLPKGAILLASAERCKIQSFKFRSIYGVQFHPELNRIKDMKSRAEFSPNYTRGRGNINFISCPKSKKILKNFLSIIIK